MCRIQLIFMHFQVLTLGWIREVYYVFLSVKMHLDKEGYKYYPSIKKRLEKGMYNNLYSSQHPREYGRTA